MTLVKIFVMADDFRPLVNYSLLFLFSSCVLFMDKKIDSFLHPLLLKRSSNQVLANAAFFFASLGLS